MVDFEPLLEIFLFWAVGVGLDYLLLTPCLRVAYFFGYGLRGHSLVPGSTPALLLPSLVQRVGTHVVKRATFLLKRVVGHCLILRLLVLLLVLDLSLMRLGHSRLDFISLRHWLVVLAECVVSS